MMPVSALVDACQHDLSAHARIRARKREIEYLHRQRILEKDMKAIMKFFDLRDRLNVFEQVAADEVERL